MALWMIEKKSMKLDSQKSESLTDILSMAEKGIRDGICQL